MQCPSKWGLVTSSSLGVIGCQNYDQSDRRKPPLDIAELYDNERFRKATDIAPVSLLPTEPSGSVIESMLWVAYCSQPYSFYEDKVQT